jgi:hypothetical protein
VTDTIDKREEYRALLRAGMCTVTFTKVSGDTRVMKCTLNTSFIPEVQIPASMEDKSEAEGSPSERSLNVLRVFDTEAKGWRSFRLDSVTDFRVGT